MQLSRKDKDVITQQENLWDFTWYRNRHVRMVVHNGDALPSHVDLDVVRHSRYRRRYLMDLEWVVN